MPVVAYFLRIIGDEVARIRDLPALPGVSKEAVAMATGYLHRDGMAEFGPQRSVTLTAAGTRHAPRGSGTAG